MVTNDPMVPNDGDRTYSDVGYVDSAEVRDPLVTDDATVGWRRWRWLLIPFLLGLALLGWGLYRLRQEPRPTTAEIAVAQCEYQAGNLALSSADEEQVMALVTEQFPNVGGQREQVLAAAKKVCLAHLCGASDPRLTDLPSIAAEEFAFAVTPGHLFSGDIADRFIAEFTGASWCHG